MDQNLLLFLGNAVLFVFWIGIATRKVKGKCPMCGK